MGKDERLTKALTYIISRVKRKGVSMKVAWSSFTKCKPLTFADFEEKINGYQQSLSHEDILTIWANIKVKGDAMGYSDFSRFVMLDEVESLKGEEKVETTKNDDSNRNQSCKNEVTEQCVDNKNEPVCEGKRVAKRIPLVNIILSNRKAIFNSILQFDRELTGIISFDEFQSIIRNIDNVNHNEIMSLVLNYCPMNSVYFNYFAMFADMVDKRGPFMCLNNWQRNNQVMGFNFGNEINCSRFQNYQNNSSYFGYRGMNENYYPNYEEQRNFYRNETNDSRFQNYPNNNNCFENLGMNENYYPNSKEPQFINKIEPIDEIDKEQEQEATKSTNLQNNNLSAPTIKPQDEISSNELDEILLKIAEKMENLSKSSSSYYNTWRRNSATIMPDDLVHGVKKDLNIDISIQQSEKIIERFSGTLDKCNFIKMVSYSSKLLKEKRSNN